MSWTRISLRYHVEQPRPFASSWFEYTVVASSETMALTELVPQIAIDNLWSSAESIGMYWPGGFSTNWGLLRGGRWNERTDAGLFTALVTTPTWVDSRAGFRCSYSPP